MAGRTAVPATGHGCQTSVWSADAVSAADEGHAVAACPSVSAASLRAQTSDDASGTRCR